MQNPCRPLITADVLSPRDQSNLHHASDAFYRVSLGIVMSMTGQTALFAVLDLHSAASGLRVDGRDLKNLLNETS